jgi:molecular chaperone GrpE
MCEKQCENKDCKCSAEHSNGSDKKGEGESKEAATDLTELLQRTQANFENYRKQVEKRIESMKASAALEVITKILPIADNFDLALRNTDHVKHGDFIKGIELIHNQLSVVLKEAGVETIKTEGELFNPHLHEALMKVESELSENTIIEELQKGFMLSGQVIRHARVKISAGNSQLKKNNKK